MEHAMVYENSYFFIGIKILNFSKCGKNNIAEEEIKKKK